MERNYQKNYLSKLLVIILLGCLNFFRPLMSTGLRLMTIVLRSSAKSDLMPLRLTAAASATDTAIQKKIDSGTTALIISKKEMEDVMRIVKYFEELDLLT